MPHPPWILPTWGDGSILGAAGIWEGVSIGACYPLSAAMAFALMALMVPLKGLLLLLCLLGLGGLRMGCPLRSGLLHPLLLLLWHLQLLLLLQLMFRVLFRLWLYLLFTFGLDLVALVLVGGSLVGPRHGEHNCLLNTHGLHHFVMGFTTLSKLEHMNWTTAVDRLVRQF